MHFYGRVQVGCSDYYKECIHHYVSPPHGANVAPRHAPLLPPQHAHGRVQQNIGQCKHKPGAKQPALPLQAGKGLENVLPVHLQEEQERHVGAVGELIEHQGRKAAVDYIIGRHELLQRSQRTPESKERQEKMKGKLGV
jgi:hypothetical protein